jgi:hypothetical protein
MLRELKFIKIIFEPIVDYLTMGGEIFISENLSLVGSIGIIIEILTMKNFIRGLFF